MLAALRRSVGESSVDHGRKAAWATWQGQYPGKPNGVLLQISQKNVLSPFRTPKKAVSGRVKKEDTVGSTAGRAVQRASHQGVPRGEDGL